jgi:eukaryotic-like serine/threonine-protein kinase
MCTLRTTQNPPGRGGSPLALECLRLPSYSADLVPSLDLGGLAVTPCALAARTMDTRAVTPPGRPLVPPEPAGPGAAHADLPGWPLASDSALDDALSEFASDADVARRTRSVKSPSRARAVSKWPIVVAAAVVVALCLAAAWRWWPASAPAGTGTVAIETSPPGASVLVDGRERGRTPLTLPLPAGTHAVTVNGTTGRRELSMTVVAGTQVVHHVELANPAPTTGRLQISGPAGAPIVLDGAPRGVTPAELADVPAGEHTVTIGDGPAAVTQRVTVPAGGVAMLLVPLRQPDGQAPAWISVVAPIELQVFDGRALIGNSTTDRILVLAGRHTINLVNAELKYQTARTVEVEAGRVATIRVEVPNGVLHVNAVPWAEVFVDGRRIGETPIANLAVPIGAHEITLRNPKFPEQKRSVVISLAGPSRLGVDLRQ